MLAVSCIVTLCPLDKVVTIEYAVLGPDLTFSDDAVTVAVFLAVAVVVLLLPVFSDTCPSTFMYLLLAYPTTPAEVFILYQPVALSVSVIVTDWPFLKLLRLSKK